MFSLKSCFVVFGSKKLSVSAICVNYCLRSSLNKHFSHKTRVEVVQHALWTIVLWESRGNRGKLWPKSGNWLVHNDLKLKQASSDVDCLTADKKWLVSRKILSKANNSIDNRELLADEGGKFISSPPNAHFFPPPSPSPFPWVVVGRGVKSVTTARKSRLAPMKWLVQTLSTQSEDTCGNFSIGASILRPWICLCPLRHLLTSPATWNIAPARRHLKPHRGQWNLHRARNRDQVMMHANWLITCCLLHKRANWLDENQFDGVITEMFEKRI